MVYTVKHAKPEPHYVARMPSETHDFIPADPDSYSVTFARGRPLGQHPTPVRRDDLQRMDLGRIVVRDIPTALDAFRIAYELDEQYGQYGRRAIIQAVKGFRGYNIPR